MTRLLRMLGAVPGYPLRAFIIGLLWATLACLIVATVCYVAGLDPVWWIVPACFAASCLFSLAVVALVSRPYVRDIEAIRANHLVHWVYAADEWARFEEAEWQRGQRNTRTYPLFSVIIALVVAALAFIGSRNLLVTLAAFGIFLAIGLLITLQTWAAGRWRYARRHKTAGDVYISRTGVLQPRGYMPYNGLNLKLTTAEVEPGDPDTLRLVISSYTVDLLTRSAEFRIPVPFGREDEAREIAEQLLGISAARGYQAANATR